MSLSAVADAKDSYASAICLKADTVVADAQTVARRASSLKLLHVANSGLSEAFKRLLDTACDALVERAKSSNATAVQSISLTRGR
jgi:hypothetical protein